MVERLRTQQHVQPETISGMNPTAYEIFQNQKDLTRHEIGVSDKKIIIPSFNTTGKLFTQHFHILRELKHRIDRLKQAYESQRSE